MARDGTIHARRLLWGRAASRPPGAPGTPPAPSLAYRFLRFLQLGLHAWGGRVAQIGMMHRELVERDRWVTEDGFRKVLALYQALPGPEATELAVDFGTLKRGRPGGLMACLGFLAPGIVLVTLLAALCVRFVETADVASFLVYGVRPAVSALSAVAGAAYLALVGLRLPRRPSPRPPRPRRRAGASAGRPRAGT